MKSFLAALQFLTVLPVPAGKVDAKQLGRSASWFPVAGLAIGAVAAGIYYLASRLIPLNAAAFLGVAAAVMIAGGLHLEGVADVCDGFYAGRTRERVLEIMKDSRVGAMGAIGIVIVFVGKVVFLAALPARVGIPGFACVIALGRWGMTVGAAISPYPRLDGTGKGFVENVGKFELILSSAFALVISVVLLRLLGLAVAGGVFIWILLLTNYFNRRIGGVTGDTLGFIGETSELMGLLLILFLAGRGPFEVWPLFIKWFG